jgi:pimeloyl-ACP methyl ester carboxylesterase
MPTATIDGIETYYEVSGSGPPLLLFSPGGFNATIENWRSFGIYARLDLVERLGEHYTCIAFDRREAGRSGGCLERITWVDYATQGRGLLDELGIDRAPLIGGCIGCSCVAAFAVAWPERVARMVLYSPAGGPRYRLTQQARFAEHLEFVHREGLAAVVELARSSAATFAQDPRVGPWVNAIRTDDAFAEDLSSREPVVYAALVEEMGVRLFDRDTVPGPSAEQLLGLRLRALVVPGHDPSHATSAARYLEECLDGSEYWDVPPEEQTAENAPARILDFLQQ